MIYTVNTEFKYLLRSKGALVDRVQIPHGGPNRSKFKTFTLTFPLMA